MEVGVSSGVTHYYGDLGNWDGPVQWNSVRPGMAVTFRNFLNNPKRYVTRALDFETSSAGIASAMTRPNRPAASRGTEP